MYNPPPLLESMLLLVAIYQFDRHPLCNEPDVRTGPECIATASVLILAILNSLTLGC